MKPTNNANGASPSATDPAFRPVVVGALYPAAERGLAADLIATRSIGGIGHPVCTLLLMAAKGTVTDATDVPQDTIRAQLEHLEASAQPNAMKIGVLGSHGAAAPVLDLAEAFGGPVVLDLELSGPSGETVLTSRGIDMVTERLSVPDLVIVSRSDAEPISGGEIQSLDDAQVAAQRLVRRGARAVVIKCGPLPARFFETREGPSADSPPFNADLYFDGDEFALFEAPHLPGPHRDGISSAFALVTLRAMTAGRPLPEALQEAKRFVTEGLRSSAEHHLSGFDFAWESRMLT